MDPPLWGQTADVGLLLYNQQALTIAPGLTLVVQSGYGNRLMHKEGAHLRVRNDRRRELQRQKCRARSQRLLLQIMGTVLIGVLTRAASVSKSK